MIGWILLGILLLLILLTFVLRLGVTACYDADGPWVKLRIGPKKVQVFPVRKDPEKKADKQKKKEEKQRKKEAKQAKKPPKPKRKPEIGGLLSMVWDLLPVVGEAAGTFRRKLQIDELVLKVSWAEEDPADTAIHYGRGWAVVEALLAFLEANFIVKKREVALYADFLSEEPRVYIRAGLSMTLAQLTAIGLKAGFKSLKILWNHRKSIFPAKKDTGTQEKKGETNHGKQASCE